LLFSLLADLLFCDRKVGRTHQADIWKNTIPPISAWLL
jgi:hypothetical protein